MRKNQQLTVLASLCVIFVLSCGRESLEMNRKEHSTLQSSSKTRHLLRLFTTSENPDIYRFETCLINEEEFISESSCVNAFYGSDQEEITLTLSETNSERIHESGAFIFSKHFSAGWMKYQEDLFSGLKQHDPKTMGAVGGGILGTTLVIGLERNLSVALAEARNELKSAKNAQNLLMQKQANIRSEITELEGNLKVLEVQSQGNDVLTEIDELVQELTMETKTASAQLDGVIRELADVEIQIERYIQNNKRWFEDLKRQQKEILHSIGFKNLEDAQKYLESKKREDLRVTSGPRMVRHPNLSTPALNDAIERIHRIEGNARELAQAFEKNKKSAEILKLERQASYKKLTALQQEKTSLKALRAKLLALPAQHKKQKKLLEQTVSALKGSTKRIKEATRSLLKINLGRSAFISTIISATVGAVVHITKAGAKTFQSESDPVTSSSAPHFVLTQIDPERPLDSSMIIPIHDVAESLNIWQRDDKIDNPYGMNVAITSYCLPVTKEDKECFIYTLY